MIYLNNSSLTDLACGRRYLYKVVKGAVTPSKEAFDIGTFFHHLMWIIRPEDNIETLVGSLRNVFAVDPATPRIPSAIWNLLNTPKHEILRIYLADIACRVRDELDLCGNRPTYRELQMESQLLDTNQLNLIGTPDLIQYDPASRHVIITDYKTTGSPVSDEKLNNYRLSSQLFFYALLASCNSEHFPAEMQAALAAKRIKFRYVLVEYKTNKFHVEPPRDMSVAAYDELVGIVREKAELAAFYHANPQAARKDGITFNHCMFCPFVNICSINNPAQEARLIAEWPLGFKPYNPKEREH